MSCKCSFLEIYNENITDLLSPSEAHLHIREDAARGTYVENLCEEEVSSGTAHDAGTCVMHASCSRHLLQYCMQGPLHAHTYLASCPSMWPQADLYCLLGNYN